MCPCMAFITFARVSNASAVGFTSSFVSSAKRFKHVMMKRTVCRGAGAAVHRTGGADLEAAVRQLRSLRDAFGHPSSCSRDIPDNPVRLIIRGFIASDVHVMHVQHETLRA